MVGTDFDASTNIRTDEYSEDHDPGRPVLYAGNYLSLPNQYGGTDRIETSRSDIDFQHRMLEFHRWYNGIGQRGREVTSKIDSYTSCGPCVYMEVPEGVNPKEFKMELIRQSECPGTFKIMDYESAETLLQLRTDVQKIPDLKDVNLSEAMAYDRRGFVLITDARNKFEQANNGADFIDEMFLFADNHGEEILAAWDRDGNKFILVSTRMSENPNNMIQDLNIKFPDSLDIHVQDFDWLDDLVNHKSRQGQVRSLRL